MMAFISYYGHVQNTSHLGKNIFISHLFGALVEVFIQIITILLYIYYSTHKSIVLKVPCWSAPFLINRFGRKASLSVFFLLSSVFSLGYGLICQDSHQARLVSGLMGRMSITAAYFVCLQYASELMPTLVRGRGVALCETAGGLAVLASPGIVYLA